MRKHPLTSLLRRVFPVAASLVAAGSLTSSEPLSGDKEVKQARTVEAAKDVHYKSRRIIKLNPQVLDIQIALGADPENAVRDMLIAKGYTNFPVRMPAKIAENLLMERKTSFGNTAHINMPTAFQDEREGQNTCVILPVESYALPDNLDTLIDQLGRDFVVHVTNKHEQAHAQDGFSSFANIFQGWAAFENLPKSMLLSRDDVFASLAAFYKAEAFADVVGIGETIRDGKGDIKTIEAFATMRAQFAHVKPDQGFVRLSTPVLRAFQQHLTHRGVGTFQALNEIEAQNVYAAVVNQNLGLSTQGAMKAFHTMQHGTKSQKEAMGYLALKNDDMAEGMKTWSSFVQAQDPILKKVLGHYTPVRKAFARREAARVNEIIRQWKPMDELRARALKEYNSLRPVDLVRAYTSMQEGFFVQMQRGWQDGDNPVYEEKALKLRTAFLNMTKPLILPYQKKQRSFNHLLRINPPPAQAFHLLSK